MIHVLCRAQHLTNEKQFYYHHSLRGQSYALEWETNTSGPLYSPRLVVFVWNPLGVVCETRTWKQVVFWVVRVGGEPGEHGGGQGDLRTQVQE